MATDVVYAASAQLNQLCMHSGPQKHIRSQQQC